ETALVGAKPNRAFVVDRPRRRLVEIHLVHRRPGILVPTLLTALQDAPPPVIAEHLEVRRRPDRRNLGLGNERRDRRRAFVEVRRDVLPAHRIRRRYHPDEPRRPRPQPPGDAGAQGDRLPAPVAANEQILAQRVVLDELLLLRIWPWKAPELAQRI